MYMYVAWCVQEHIGMVYVCGRVRIESLPESLCVFLTHLD